VLQTVIGKKFLEDYCLISSDKAAWILSLMGITSALSGLGFALFSRILGNRRRIFMRIVGVMCVLVFSTITVLLFLDVRNISIAVLMCLLACVASTSSIGIPLLQETNFSEYVGAAVSLFNFTFFIAVALFGNAVGFLMNIFPPEMHNGIQFYGANSYLAVFGTLTVFSCIVAWTAFHLQETMGRNIATKTV
jgi:MFS family permease